MEYSYKNILIRSIHNGDTNLIVKWRNSESVKKNLYIQTNLTEEEHLWWMKNKVMTGECSQFIIETISPKKAIGTVLIKNIDKINKKGEFGIFIGEDDLRGKGYGTISTRLILEHSFKELLLNKVYLSVFKDNIIGIKCYEKSGFKIDGILRQDIKRDTHYYDIVIMSLIKNEWKGIV